MKLVLTGIEMYEQLKLTDYGTGTYTGTPTKLLAVNSAGQVIEEDMPAAIQIGYKVDQTPDNGTYGTLAGSVNSSNTVFTTSTGSYISGTLVVYVNGQLQTQGASNDFQETVPSSGTFTFVTAPTTGDIITAYYQTSSSYASGIEVLDEGSSLTSFVSSLNFVGSGVTATNTGDAVTVTIAGGGGSVDGTGTATYIPKWVDSDTLTDSIMREQVINTVPYIGVGTAAEEFIQFKVSSLIAAKGDWGNDNYVYLDSIGKVIIHQIRPAIELTSYSDPDLLDKWIIDVRSTEEGLVIKPDNTSGSNDASFRVRNKSDADKFVVNFPDNLVQVYYNLTLDGGTTPLELRFLEDSTNGTNYTGFKAPANLGANLMYTMPSVAPSNGQVLTWNTGGGLSWETASGGVSDGDKGDITVSSGGTVWTIDAAAVTLAKMADVATSSVFYRKTAGVGAPEVQTLATLKADLDLTGTNSGDQTITLTGDVTGTGTGSFATTIAVGAGGIYEGSGTIASGTVSTVTASSTFGIDYAGGSDALVVNDTAGTVSLLSKTTGALSLVSDIVSLQGKSSTSAISELRFYEASVNGSNYTGLKASTILAGDAVFTLPSQLPSTTQVMTSTNAGVLGFANLRNFRTWFVTNTDGFIQVVADQNEDGISYYSDDNSIRMVGDNAYGGPTDDAISFRISIDKLTNSLTQSTLATGDLFIVWDVDAAENKKITASELSSYFGGGGVSGPVSSVNNNIATFDGTDGDTIKDSGITLTTVSADSFELARGTGKLRVVDNSGSGDAIIIQLGATGTPQIGTTSVSPQNILTTSSQDIVSNKAIIPRSFTAASPADINIDGGVDLHTVSALANTLDITDLIATSPYNGQKVTVRIKDNGTSRTLTWDVDFISFLGTALPTATVAGKWMYFGMIYYDATEQWHVIAYMVEN